MRIGVFDTKPYDRFFLQSANNECGDLEWVYFEPRLKPQTVGLVQDLDVVCVFVNDLIDRFVLERLKAAGVKLLALRCAGFNNVDVHAATELDLPVVRVPAYSPYAVAEHAVGMMLSLNRKFHRAYQRVREANFSLEGLLGFDMHGRTAGIIGTGKIGQIVGKILHGFGCELLAYDLFPSDLMQGTYVGLEELLSRSDIVTLHCPLTPTTHHLIREETINLMKPGTMLINTSRGALVDTKAVIEALKSRRIGYLGLDVYEEEEDLFFEDHSAEVLEDDVFARLLTFPNVLITAHQAFFTRDALSEIARTTLENICAIQNGTPLQHQIVERHAP